MHFDQANANESPALFLLRSVKGGSVRLRANVHRAQGGEAIDLSMVVILHL